ncbi:MAG: 16S rRNA (adenine(1518)-N(6)/adenine(1519)-N(6))-dimethyltransferase RsmA [Devosia sp.]
MQIDDLPPLRDVIARHGLSAKKQLGQNFLLDLNLTAKIARAAGPLTDHTIIEVGPGPGGLTRALLAEGARKIIAIERDERALPALAEIQAAYPDRLAIISGDAMEIDYAALAEGPTRIVANLPYNIGTELLIGWLTTDPWPPYFESLTLMFQREVAERIVAQPNDDAYGRLGVLCGWRTDARIAFNVGRENFTPQPNVTSAIVHLTPKRVAPNVRIKDLEAVTKAAFGQRRKMVRQSLKATGVPVEMLLAAADLKGDERAETLPVEAFLKMAKALRASRSGPADPSRSSASA